MGRTIENNHSSEHIQVSLVIPVFNEQESLPLLHEQIRASLDVLSLSWEAILIDDGSSDGSADVVRTLQQGDDRIVLVTQRRNLGKSLALNIGFQLARGDYVVTLDADLQDDPAEIPRLLDKLAEGYDLVTGWKYNRHDPPSKTIPSRIANSMTARFTGLRIHDMNCGLKAYRAAVCKSLYLYGDLHRFIPIMAHFSGFRVTELAVTHHARRFGQSKYGIGRLFTSGFDLLTLLFLNQYGYRPMHLFGLSGTVLTLVGLVINLYLTVEWIAGHGPLSQRPLLFLGVLLMLFGLQLFTTGLLAEMILTRTRQNDDPLRTVASVEYADAGSAESST